MMRLMFSCFHLFSGDVSTLVKLVKVVKIVKNWNSEPYGSSERSSEPSGSSENCVSCGQSAPSEFFTNWL